MLAYILAGGRGTRLWPLSDMVPKPLLPAGDGRPFIRHIVERVLSAGFFPLLLVNHCDHSRFRHEFRDMSTAVIAQQPSGTLPALLGAMASHPPDGPFLVVYGDDLSFTDYGELMEFHQGSQADITLALLSGVPMETGLVEIAEGGVVTHFAEKPPVSGLVWTGVACMGEAVFSRVPQEHFTDLAFHLFPHALAIGLRIKALVKEGPLVTLNSISQWQQAKERTD